MVDQRFNSVNKTVNNTYQSTIIVKDLSESIAQELETVIELLNEMGDTYTQRPGLVKAIQVIRDHSTEKEM
jgi:hypothetical protein